MTYRTKDAVPRTLVACMESAKSGEVLRVRYMDASGWTLVVAHRDVTVNEVVELDDTEQDQPAEFRRPETAE